MFNSLFSAPTQWTRVPVLVKIYKLIVNELSNQMESNIASGLHDEEELVDVSFCLIITDNWLFLLCFFFFFCLFFFKSYSQRKR